jgi:hypothetical protein
MRLARAFGRFWFDFLIGDDWRIAAGVVLVLALGGALVAAGAGGGVAPGIAAGIVAVLAVSLARRGH